MSAKIEIKSIPYKATWKIRHQVMWPEKDIEYVKLPKDEDGFHYGLFVKEKMVSIISFFVEGQEAQFRKFATLKEEQGKGYGSKLLQFIIQEMYKRKLQKVWCNARVNKATYYERFGLQATRHSFTKGGIDYVIMEKYLV